MIQHAPGDLINAVGDVANTVLRGNLKLSKPVRRRLKRHQKDIDHLSQKRRSVKSRRQIIQRGGFIGPLIGAVLPAIIGLLSK